ncbi:IS982 family transposase [uncultured Alistipes sp.]|uniref:IS982 family transposase n=1 Tax=uncultured Alistipes sp. TaxID=538949 RepID=UPI00258D99CF|nr:IS982 family transposase [uncultured Alistipes sp.]
MITEDKITEIFCIADDFCKYFSSELKKHQIADGKKHRNKSCKLSEAEVITILILFHSKGFRCLKHFYTQYVCKHMRHLFPQTVSYNRFVELQKSVVLHLTMFIKEVLLGTCTGVAYVDSTPLRVCKHQRIPIHKTFKGLAERGKCSMGWFFGFKLHLIINDRGEILSFMFTPGNVDDREPLYSESFIGNVKGKLCGDKGNIGKQLFEFLFMNGIQLVTKVKSNMRNSLMSVADKIMLRKRALVESVNDELKNIAQIEHSRHRSFTNFITNALSAIAAYCFFPKKPSISLEYVFDNQLTLF